MSLLLDQIETLALDAASNEAIERADALQAYAAIIHRDADGEPLESDASEFLKVIGTLGISKDEAAADIAALKSIRAMEARRVPEEQINALKATLDQADADVTRARAALEQATTRRAEANRTYWVQRNQFYGLSSDIQRLLDKHPRIIGSERMPPQVPLVAPLADPVFPQCNELPDITPALPTTFVEDDKTVHVVVSDPIQNIGGQIKIVETNDSGKPRGTMCL
jgi:hypothetical protein